MPEQQIASVMNFFKPYVPKIVLLAWVLTILSSCKKAESITPTVNSSANLITKSWLFDQASAVGGGYRLDFQRGKGDDQFGLANVRVKFNGDGTISGTDNIGNSIKNGTWKLIDNARKITISGTSVFGIDGTSTIDKLDETNLSVSNTLDVPQIGTITIQGVLVHER